MILKMPAKSLKPEEIQKLAEFYEILIKIDRRNKIIKKDSKTSIYE